MVGYYWIIILEFQRKIILTVVLCEKWQTLEIEKKWKKFPRNFFIIWLHFCYCFGLNFNIQLKNLVVSQNFMVLYTILISSSLIYIHVNSFVIITSSVVSGYLYLTLTWETKVQSPFKPRPFFTFFSFSWTLPNFHKRPKLKFKKCGLFSNEH